MPILALEAAYETDIDNTYTTVNIAIFDEFDFKLTAGIGYSAKLIDSKELESLIGLRIGYKYHLLKRLAFEPKASIRYNLNTSDFEMQPVLEVDYYLTPSISIVFKGGYNTFQKTPIIGMGLTYKLGFQDDDRDWVRNDLDLCPRTPHSAKVNTDGCGLDTDGDGVFDGIDNCPNTPLSAFVDSTGCPSDFDNDGVFDGVDKCPETPSGINVDSSGCPADIDFDGVSDFEDDCPETPDGAEVDTRGCPKDSDEDGILDGIDQCPGTPTGFEVDRFGCPYTMPIDSTLVFDLYDASLNLRGKAVGELEKIAQRIRAYPDRKVVLRVYTDSEGSPRFNYNRSAQVLNKVKAFFIERGIDEELLETKPMGEKTPIASNATAEGIRKNRRLEIIAQ